MNSDTTKRTTPEGATVEVRGSFPRYASGRSDYTITGSREAVDAEVERIKRRWPPPGYGTWFNWPPPPDGPLTWDKRPSPHLAPVEVSPGVWQARGYHSHSCD